MTEFGKDPSPTPPHKGEGLTVARRLRPCLRHLKNWLKGSVAVPQVKPLPLVGRGWGGVLSPVVRGGDAI